MSTSPAGMTPPTTGMSAHHPEADGPHPQIRFTAVAAVAANGVIGVDGELVWRNRADLQRLKALTMGHTLVMGRKNFDSIGRPLPGRHTVVITRQPDWAHEGVTVVHDTSSGLDAALRVITTKSGDGEVFIFGGGEIYAQLMGRAEAMEITEIAAPLDGDVHFPPIDPDDWWEISREQQDGYAWVRYVRRALPIDAC